MSNVAEKGKAVKDVAEYSDDTLATMADELAREAERLGRLARGAHQELLARMLEREATKLDTEHWEGVVKPGQIHHTVDDVDRLLGRLTPLIGWDDIHDVFIQPPQPPMRADHRNLNELHKRGGEIARVIEEERRSVRGESQLVLTRKATVNDP